MNGIVSFKIELERPDGIYSGGEMVVGKVTLVTSRDIETRGIHIKKQCCGFSRYSETIYTPPRNKNGRGSYKTISHVNKKLYEELRCTLLGDYFSGTGSVIQRTVLPAGTFERAFSFPLHVGVIGSVEVCLEDGDLANIRHLLNAFVDLGTIYDPSEGPANRSTEIPITILPSHQLPSPDMLQPIQNFNYLPRRIPRMCFFSKGTFAMSAKLWRQAYAPGEALDFNFSVTNNSSVSLVMTVTLFSYISINSSSKTIEHSIHRAYVEPHTTYEIGYDSLNPDREIVAASSTSLSLERKLVVPTVPLTFQDMFAVRSKIEFTTSTYQGWETSTTASFNLVICAAAPPLAVLRAVRGIDASANIEHAGADRGYALVQQDDASPVALGDAPVTATGIESAPVESEPSAIDPVTSLIHNLRSSPDLRATIRIWATVSSYATTAKSLSPESLQRVLQSVTVSTDQIVVAKELAQLIQPCTCAHVVAALDVCPSVATEVASCMVPYVQDKENKFFVLGLLSEGDQDKVEAMFV